MKKLAILGSTITSLLTPIKIGAAETINIKPPDKGFPDLGTFINNAIIVVLGFGVLVVLVMLIIGAYEWITSGGDKEAVGKARNRIINALIGLAVLAIAFALARLAATFVGFDILKIEIPSPT